MKIRTEIPDEEVRTIELAIFSHIVKICEKYNLRYIIDYGTLLGAVRHGGFIPWDDDIDISMPRPDYEIFKNIFPEETKTSSQYELRTGMIGNIAIPYIQVVHTGTITEKKGRREKYAQSVWVDVFPVDGAGVLKEDLEENYKDYWKKITETRKILGRYKPYRNPVKQLRQFYNHYIRSFQLGKIVAQAEACMKKYEYDACEDIFCLATIYGTKEKNKKEYYEDRIEIEFEGISCKVPRAYDQKLRDMYGDYEKLPPVEKRKGHDFVAYYK
ncbi:MAG: phosphorylcholine transferase LicD [Eubacterium sp.]